MTSWQEPKGEWGPAGHWVGLGGLLLGRGPLGEAGQTWLLPGMELRPGEGRERSVSEMAQCSITPGSGGDRDEPLSQRH